MPILESPALSIGFRPFYLVAVAFAVASIVLWLCMYLGFVSWDGYLNGVVWHSHEMVFGFAIAVIAGFLLTAVKNWTGLPTPQGASLVVLVGLWMLGRIFVVTGPSTAAVIIDLAFLPALMFGLAVPIIRSRNFRNVKLLVILGLMVFANLCFHLSQTGIIPFDVGRVAILAALDLIAILIAVMAGRIIPAFTNNAVPEAKPKKLVAVEWLAVGSLAGVLMADLVSHWQVVSKTAWLVLLMVGAFTHVVRFVLWQPQKTRHLALLWMLPVAYIWLPVWLLLRAVTLIEPTVVGSIAVHAFTIGAIASLMLAMMARSARGHTGRPLVAGSIEISAFLLLQFAVLLRVGPGLIWPEYYSLSLVGSGVLWVAAFCIFLLGYWRILLRPGI